MYILFRGCFEMENALSRVGLYDFFTILLSGMTAIIIDYCINGDLEKNLTKILNNKFNNIIIFLLIGYFIGIILQEISSIFDKKIKIFKFRQKAMRNFLNEHNKIVKNKIELKEYQELANKILKKDQTPDEYTEEECEYVYYYCKTQLELNCKSDKMEKINATYGTSRSLMFALIIIGIRYLYYNKSLSGVIFVVLCILIGLFYKRCKRFSEYRVRVILRQYKSLNVTS